MDSSRNLQGNYIISFLFRLYLILHACKILIRYDSFGILNFASKQDVCIKTQSIKLICRAQQRYWLMNCAVPSLCSYSRAGSVLHHRDNSRSINLYFLPLPICHPALRPCLIAVCKIFEMASFYIWSTKRRLITK